MKYIVYCTRNNKNSKIYIGVHGTEDPQSFDGYIGCGIYSTNKVFKTDTAFKHAVKKYGASSFTRVTLAIFNTSEEAYDLERQLVTEDFVRRRDTYNMALGGRGGSGELNKIKVAQYDLNGVFIKTFKSVTEAAKEVEASPGDISNAVNKKQLSCKGFIWMKDIGKNPLTIRAEFGNSKKIVQYSRAGNRVKIWTSATVVARYYKIDSSIISAVCKGDSSRKLIAGFQWRFESDFIKKLPAVDVDKSKI